MTYAAANGVARLAIFAIVARLQPVTLGIADHDIPPASMVAMPPTLTIITFMSNGDYPHSPWNEVNCRRKMRAGGRSARRWRRPGRR